MTNKDFYIEYVMLFIIVHKLKQFIVNPFKTRKKLVAALFCSAMIMPLLLIAACFYTIDPYKKYVVSAGSADHADVGIVLGAGITKEGKPYKELQARLDSAAEALNNGTVNKLILSGDNRFSNYDEPGAMKRYLIKNKGIAADKLNPDYGGRSTYESCERAAKIFNIKKLVIFSAGSHLPRAIYLCRHFGIETYGVANGVEANNSTRRELLARVKAIYNVYMYGERTILGAPIPLS